MTRATRQDWLLCVITLDIDDVDECMTDTATRR